MQKVILKFILTGTLILLSLVQLSCQTNDKNSVLVIAVDGLAVGDVNCNEEPGASLKSGFHLLCKESVRFTHAFTTSTLSVPALASVLTGLYPFQHKVHHNDGPPVAPELELSSEVAVHQDYRTSFFSGGAPVFRRSGLNQGFELFDDNIIPAFNGLFRPFSKSTGIFLQWLKHDVGSSPFFTVFYAPDLSFTTTLTTTELGEARNLSFESQFDEFDFNLYQLIQQMKLMNRWDHTTVILVGLNGRNTSDRAHELNSLNLHSENTQVALFIKPAQKSRDEAIYWKIDQNVSLADVGRTLYDLLGMTNLDQQSSDGEDSGFPSHSLANILKKPTTEWTENRPLLMESGWSLWRNAGPLRTAGIAQHVLLINDQTPLLYNTLVDRFEVNQLPLLQESILPTTKNLQKLFAQNQFPAFSPPNSEWMTKLSLPYSRWMRADQEPLLLKDLKRLYQNSPNSMDLMNWAAQIALNQKDWDTLRNLGVKNKVSVWEYVGEKNLNLKNTKTADSCLALLGARDLDSTQLKTCDDPLFLELIDWLRADTRGLSKDTQRKKFERSFKNYMLDQDIQRANIALGMIWATSSQNIFAPSRTELALHLPEFAKLKAQVYKSLSTIDEED